MGKQIVKLNAFWLGPRQIIFLHVTDLIVVKGKNVHFFTAVWHGIDLPVALNTDTQSVTFQYFNLFRDRILFLTFFPCSVPAE